MIGLGKMKFWFASNNSCNYLSYDGDCYYCYYYDKNNNNLIN
jgi:hypothetical protein